MKRLLCNTLIIIMIVGVCFNGCFDFVGLSVSNRFSYAEADNWSACDSSDLVTAFRYYCKSRNLALEGSAADSLTTFTTTTFNNICSTLGIDPTSLQAELKKTTEGNLGLRFLFSNTGIAAYNRIFAEFLQNNNLSEGDSVDNQVIYSGKSFTDANGHNCLLYVINNYPTSYLPESAILQWGTPYVYTNSQLIGMVGGYSPSDYNTTVSFNLTDNVTYTARLSKYRWGSTNQNVGGSMKDSNNANSIPLLKSNGNNYAPVDGTFIIFYSAYDKNIYFGAFGKELGDSPPFKLYGYRVNGYYNLSGSSQIQDTDVTVDTPDNTVINNNNYNYNYTIIYNDGDHYGTDDDEPLPSTPPGGGGGGGGNPSDPDPNDPVDPYDPDKQFPDTPDNPTTDPGIHGGVGSDGTITFPDFNFDIPEINWSLDGLQHKFPFSLPFDLYNCCKLLNAEPETPELDYTVNLVVYDWRVNYDLHWLDPAARVIRIFELLAFVVGLILITRRLIGG